MIFIFAKAIFKIVKAIPSKHLQKIIFNGANSKLSVKTINFAKHHKQRNTHENTIRTHSGCPHALRMPNKTTTRPRHSGRRSHHHGYHQEPRFLSANRRTGLETSLLPQRADLLYLLHCRGQHVLFQLPPPRPDVRSEHQALHRTPVCTTGRQHPPGN